MRKFMVAATAATTLAFSAGSAGAASLYFDFDESQSVFQVTSSTPSCPFQPNAWCQVTGALADNPFDTATVEEGDTYAFDFGVLTVGGGVGKENDAHVFAKLAFTSPVAPSASTSSNLWYVTAFGLLSAGALTWTTPTHNIVAADGSEFTVRFKDISGFAVGGKAYAPVEITVNSVAVPEPATWALMIGGFGLAGGALRRRRSITA